MNALYDVLHTISISIEEDMYHRLYVYRMSTVEKYSGSYGYEVPEDKTKLYEESMISNESVLDCVGAN